MDRWSGRVAVVTGASSGIGAAIVRDLVTHGLVVVGLARRDGKMQEIAEELKDCSGQLFPVRADITKEEDILAAFRWIERKLGGVDVLVNNAGMSINTEVIECKLSDWKRMFDLNVFAQGMCTREAVRSMRSRKVEDGHIININSIASHRVSIKPGNFIYCASKHAARVFTEGLRRELAEVKSKIKVTSISPGLVDTEIFEVGSWGKEIYSNNPYLQAKDIADAVNYLLSTSPSVQVNELIVRPVAEGT
uniref:Dehydrogenase n=1 Tax=Clastoptera arizonana TaxID=38151 RepID=A0A1B6EEU8_9HEMI